ncbi:MAG: glycosyltransferase [Cyclobacteriaceae bacterium]
MKKRRLVIASVLKPIDDTRMYEKMATSLSKLDHWEVAVIGYPSKHKPAQAGITFLDLQPFSRISFSRLVAPLRIFKIIIQLRPEVLIVNTYELLIVAIANRILFGTKIIYDIRENYFRNIGYTSSIGFLLRWPLAALVRLKEKLLAPSFHHFILAEKGYESEFSFFRNRFTLLENRSVKRSVTVTTRDRSRLLFSGTIARSTGVFEAIKLAVDLHKLDPSITLTLAGYCATESCRREIKVAIAPYEFVKCVGLDHLVPHSQIMNEIDRAGFGIVYYPSSPSTVNSIPTKLYEYLANRLPIITCANQSFAGLVTQHGAGILADGTSPVILDRLKGIQCYNIPIPDIYWEEQKFQDLIQEQF